MSTLTLTRIAPSTSTLVATSCGTAIASVCTIGLFQIEQLLGGVWSVAAVCIAGLCCAALARVFARLAEVVPSGAGLLAYFSRGYGRPVGMALTTPYFFLTLFLAGAEATIVGFLGAQLVPLSPWLVAVLFLILTWACCRAGLHVSYRVQALATWTLIGALATFALLALLDTAAHGQIALRLFSPPPSPAHFVAAVGQALFLFMGFELITGQVESGTSAQTIGSALRWSVAVLTGVYALVALGFACLAPSFITTEQWFLPQLAIAQHVGGPMATSVIILLSFLASFTSLNGALLALSRFTCALASQGVLPRHFAQIKPRTLVPTHALAALLIVALLATALVLFAHALHAAIFAAAVSAALIYASAVWVCERPPFTIAYRPATQRYPRYVLAGSFVILGFGVLLDAGPALPQTLALLAVASGAAAVTAYRTVHKTVLTHHLDSQPQHITIPAIADALRTSHSSPGVINGD
jgi:amino acid transporter